MLGSKIDNLSLLINNNINVPKFFIIKFEDVIDTKNVDFDNKENCKELKKIIRDSIKIKYKNNLKTKYYSVRSSCNLEDSDNYSFAGQFDTYLNVEEKDLDKKILDCFLSLYNENVLEYTKEKNINISDLKMNVIVQEMVDSRVSGVLFTSNPQGIINETVIVTSSGLGENVVQDKGEVTSYYYNNTDKIYYYEGRDIITKKEIEKLIAESNKIKNLLGDYLDIEFAFTKSELYILQARKITTINDSNLLVMDNSNIVESYPNISLPLTISFVHSVYSSVFKRLVSRVLKNKNELKKLDKVFNNMTGSVNGRVYYKISNWYTLLTFLPFSEKIIPIWQEMLGVKTKNISTNEVKIKKSIKLKIILNYIHELLTVTKNMSKLNKEFTNVNDYFYSNFNKDLSNKEILKLYEKVENKLLKNWDITLINDMYAFIYTALLKSHLKKKYKDNYENITNKYISGITNIESLKPIKELVKLSYNEDKYSKEEFSKLKQDYISIYGDRALEELKLESKTFRTNPELLDEKIKEYQKDLNKLETIYKDLNLNKEKNNKSKEGILTRFLIKKVSVGIGNREISRLNRSRVYGMVREMILAIGNNSVKDQIISNQKDIFYLTLDEIKNISKDVNYKEIIKIRKNKYKNYELLPAYSRIIFMDKEFDKVLNDISINREIYDEDTIQGTPCSFGTTEGEVLVIDDINNIKDVKDKILVTKMTDPGWVFLLASAKGIISEKGSLLSHTAIISRELKIPAIVGVDNLLKKLKTGDHIKMNAATGEIRIIKRS